MTADYADDTDTREQRPEDRLIRLRRGYGVTRKSDDDAAALHFPARDGQDQSWLR